MREKPRARQRTIDARLDVLEQQRLAGRNMRELAKLQAELLRACVDGDVAAFEALRERALAVSFRAGVPL